MLKTISQISRQIKHAIGKKNTPRIEIFARYCIFSAVSEKKERHSFFSRQGCYENLLHTIRDEKVGLTFFLDAYHGDAKHHFLMEQKKYPVVVLNEGSEAGSFLRMLEHIETLRLPPDAIIYLLEDDYLHRSGWVNILREAFSIEEASYVTLYDHKDKYFASMYKDLRSKIYLTNSSHWRSIPSTTNTYAMRYQTFLEHREIHKAFSEGRTVSSDHEKFLKLGEGGSLLISPIPGWSTHLEPTFESPCIDWQKVLSQTTANFT